MRPSGGNGPITKQCCCSTVASNVARGQESSGLRAGAEHETCYATLHKNLSFSFFGGNIGIISASLELLRDNIVNILLINTYHISFDNGSLSSEKLTENLQSVLDRLVGCACITRLVSGEGHRAAELVPVSHSGVTVNTDLVGAVRPEA